ncbi:uncharacterized protein G2W53_012336 [Senna tora]|uniref:Uncharacterized protein n=1 Tax=Senna tora TaxID=362788 RepID=A0A834TWW5_9FABA|nr:uncharacterized protein G2W53_012336 [Senna tora]
MYNGLSSGKPESYRSISARGECLEFNGEDDDDELVSESEFLHVLFQPHPDSPKIYSEKSSVLVESEHTVVFLINLGALGEHLQGGSGTFESTLLHFKPPNLGFAGAVHTSQHPSSHKLSP